MNRVLHVCSCLRGGVSCFIFNYMEHFDHTKIVCDFVVSNDDCVHLLKEKIAKQSGKYFVIPLLKIPLLPFNLVRIFFFFCRNRNRYKVIHVHQPGIGFIYLLYGWFFHIPVRIMHAHAMRFSSTSIIKEITSHILTVIFRPFATDFWGCSDAAGKVFFGDSIWKSKGVFVKNAININLFSFSFDTRQRVRKQLGIGDEQFVVLHVGELIAIKNPLFLIDVFKEIVQRNPKSCLISCGKLTMKNEVESRIKEYNLTGKILLLGNQASVAEYFMAADVFLFPSISEGFAMAVLEAQAADLPCVISDSIPPEVCITDLVVSLSLREPCSVWAEYALKLKKSIRKTRASEFLATGYEIENAAQKLQEMYLAFMQK